MSDIEKKLVEVMALAREAGDIERRACIGKAQGFDVRDAYIALEAGIRALIERPAKKEYVSGVILDCEACLTPDACAIRGQCAHYLRERERPAGEPVAVIEWRRARQAAIEATHAYNAALIKARQQDEINGFGFGNANKEFQAMTEASNAAHRLVGPLLDALAASPQERPGWQWVPISERLPEDINEYVIWLHRGRVNMQLARLKFFFACRPPDDFTHWIPLPAAPKEPT